MLTVNANAKINLTLDVLGKRDGYHILDMIVSSISLADEVTVIERKDKKCFCFMDEKQVNEDNSGLEALRLMQATFKTNGFNVYIKKNIPLAGGLGGSTADGVAVVKAIAKILDIPDKKITNDLLIKIGSDAPCMYLDGIKRVQGKGEIVTHFGRIWPYQVGILSGKGINTALCYKTFDDMNLRGSSNTEKFIKHFEKYNQFPSKFIGNDLLKPALMLDNKIKNSMDIIKSLNPIAYNMSGSGSSVYGLFKKSVPDNLLNSNLI